jgi:hypothetical protein
VTGAEFSGVDIDLLADYVGGALDGTPDEAVVAALIVEDPSWRDAHALLSGGVATVSSQLRALDSVPEPMPAEFVARLDAALLAAAADTEGKLAGASHALGTAGAAQTRPTDELTTTAAALSSADRELDGSSNRSHADGELGGSASPSRADGELGDGVAAPVGGPLGEEGRGAAPGPAAMEPGSDGVAPARHLVAVPSRGGRRRARRLRWAAPVGIAAGVIAFLGFGIQQFGTGSSEDSATSAGSASAPREAAPQVATNDTLALPSGPAQIIASGIDYRRDTLDQVPARALAVPESGDQSDNSRKSTGTAFSGADSALSRLSAQPALLACVEAISAENGVGTIAAQTIDFARYDGAPALVVQFTASNGTWVWASGADCGTPGVGAATLAAVKVG